MLSSSDAPPAAIYGTCLRQSSANSPEQRCRGEEDSIHPPLSYFLLIVVFVTVKEITIVNSCPPPMGFFVPLDDSNEYDDDDGIATSVGGGERDGSCRISIVAIQMRWDTRFWMSWVVSSKLGAWTSSSSLILLLDASLAVCCVD